MIESIFGNKTNVLILRLLTRFKNEALSAEQISAQTGAGLRNVYDSLISLVHENVLIKDNSSRTAYYKFIVNSKINELINDMFEEERTRLYLNTNKTYRTIAEIESKIIKVLGSNLVDILLFGSVAKGKETYGSDIDICILIEREDDAAVNNVKSALFSLKLKNEIQPHVFTIRTFLKAKEQGNPLVESIIRDGISLKLGR